MKIILTFRDNKQENIQDISQEMAAGHHLHRSGMNHHFFNIIMFFLWIY